MWGNVMSIIVWMQVKLRPRPWLERWERQNLKGIEDPNLHPKVLAKAEAVAKPWEKYDLMMQYRYVKLVGCVHSAHFLITCPQRLFQENDTCGRAGKHLRRSVLAIAAARAQEETETEARLVHRLIPPFVSNLALTIHKSFQIIFSHQFKITSTRCH